MLDKVSATAIKCLSVTQMLPKTHLESTLQNNETWTPRDSYGQYSQLIIESNQSCLRIIAILGGRVIFTTQSKIYDGVFLQK